MKRNAFGQIISLPPFLRYADEPSGGGGGGKDFTPPASQEDLDKIVNSRLERERKKYEGFDDYKAKAEQFDALDAAKPKDEPKPKDDDGKPSGVSADDVQKRIDDALAAERKELALERVTDQLEKALDGRNYAASKLFALDRSQFIAKDGKSVDTDALKAWVEDNSTKPEEPEKNRKLPGQGQRTDGGDAAEHGRSAYQRRHGKKQQN